MSSLTAAAASLAAGRRESEARRLLACSLQFRCCSVCVVFMADVWLARIIVVGVSLHESLLHFFDWCYKFIRREGGRERGGSGAAM